MAIGEPYTVDELAARTGLDTASLLAQLGALEISGRVGRRTLHGAGRGLPSRLRLHDGALKGLPGVVRVQRWPLERAAASHVVRDDAVDDEHGAQENDEVLERAIELATIGWLNRAGSLAVSDRRRESRDWAMSSARQRVGRRTWFSNQRGRPRFPVPRLHGKPDVPCVHARRVRLHVESGVAAPTRVHTIPKGALIMVISTRFSISADGYEESND